MRARLSLPYKLVVASERNQPILTARQFAIRHKHRLHVASGPQHPYVSMANGIHAHPSFWHFSLFIIIIIIRYRIPTYIYVPNDLHTCKPSKCNPCVHSWTMFLNPASSEIRVCLKKIYMVLRGSFKVMFLLCGLIPQREFLSFRATLQVNFSALSPVHIHPGV